MSARLEIFATLLVLLMPAAYAATARLVIDSGGARQEMTIVALDITPGLTVRVVPDLIHANGFEPSQRAPPVAALTATPPDADTLAGATDAGSRGKGSRMNRDHGTDRY